MATGAIVSAGAVGRVLAVGGIGVGDSGVIVAGAVGIEVESMAVSVGTEAAAGAGVAVGTSVAGRTVGVEPEQAANKIPNKANSSVEAPKCLKNFEGASLGEKSFGAKSLGRGLNMLTLILRAAVCCRMCPLPWEIAPLTELRRVYHRISLARRRPDGVGSCVPRPVQLPLNHR